MNVPFKITFAWAPNNYWTLVFWKSGFFPPTVDHFFFKHRCAVWLHVLISVMAFINCHFDVIINLILWTMYSKYAPGFIFACFVYQAREMCNFNDGIQTFMLLLMLTFMIIDSHNIRLNRFKQKTRLHNTFVHRSWWKWYLFLQLTRKMRTNRKSKIKYYVQTMVIWVLVL